MAIDPNAPKSGPVSHACVAIPISSLQQIVFAHRGLHAPEGVEVRYRDLGLPEREAKAIEKG